MTRFLVHAVGLVLALSTALYADFDEKTDGLDKREGLIETYVNQDKAQVMLALTPQADGSYGRYVYAPYLTGGLGSNPVGLDRSVPVPSQLLVFRRAGDKMFAVAENTDFRATSDNAGERQAVKTSFAESVLWSTDIAAEGDGKVLIDFSSFLIRDGVGVAARLKGRGQGSFKLDKDLSYVDAASVHVFEENLEFDAVITFTSSNPGVEVQTTTPEPTQVSLIAHTTLIKLPEPGYTPRRYEQRAGLIPVTYVDMSAPLAGDVVTRLARRFRLEKDASGKVVNPIVFYVDHGVPEPMRSALHEGASWWATAFDKAGFPGGYRVEILPEDVHPLDARYNVINWVHRATRGWSYGWGVADPRTGEMLRGVVLLGSLRVRQDIKIFEALMGADKTGTGAPDDPVQIALARIRQLAAHEVGHALGFAHNMAASTYGGRASVMDYPAPDIRLTNGEIDASNAYGVGMGVWDDWSVEFLYGDYGADGERTAQEQRLKAAHDAGLVFVEDGDSRDVGSGHWRGGLWDTGSDAVSSLETHLAVRSHALARFGEDNLRSGEGWAALHTKLVPLYLYHRYQLQAAAKWVGGLDFAYRAEGDGRPSARAVDWDAQLRALDAVLTTLSADALRLPDGLLDQLAPLYSADGDPQYNRERFQIAGAPLFDQSTATAVASNLVFDALLHPRRLVRIAEQGQRLDGYGGLDAVFGRIGDVVFARAPRDPADAAIQAVVQERYVEHLIARYAGSSASRPVIVGTNVVRQSAQNRLPVTVMAALRAELSDVRSRLARITGRQKAVARLLVERIDNAFARQSTPAFSAPITPATPPGSPIGAETCWHCQP